MSDVSVLVEQLSSLPPRGVLRWGADRGEFAPGFHPAGWVDVAVPQVMGPLGWEWVWSLCSPDPSAVLFDVPDAAVFAAGDDDVGLVEGHEARAWPLLPARWSPGCPVGSLVVEVPADATGWAVWTSSGLVPGPRQVVPVDAVVSPGQYERLASVAEVTGGEVCVLPLWSRRAVHGVLTAWILAASGRRDLSLVYDAAVPGPLTARVLAAAAVLPSGPVV